MTRFDTLFCLRYAERVLERYGRFWERADKATRFFSLLSGSTSFAALMTQNKDLSLALGICFAVFQAIEFAISPASISMQAKTNIRLYSDILISQHTMTDQQLEEAYSQIEDKIIVPDSIRLAAYNDILLEKGGDPASLYPFNRWQKLISFIS